MLSASTGMQALQTTAVMVRALQQLAVLAMFLLALAPVTRAQKFGTDDGWATVSGVNTESCDTACKKYGLKAMVCGLSGPSGSKYVESYCCSTNWNGEGERPGDNKPKAGGNSGGCTTGYKGKEVNAPLKSSTCLCYTEKHNWTNGTRTAKATPSPLTAGELVKVLTSTKASQAIDRHSGDTCNQNCIQEGKGNALAAGTRTSAPFYYCYMLVKTPDIPKVYEERGGYTLERGGCTTGYGGKEVTNPTSYKCICSGE